MITKKIVLALAAMGFVAFAAPTVYAQDTPATDDGTMTNDGTGDMPMDPDGTGDDSMSSPEDGGDMSGDQGDGSGMDGMDNPDQQQQ